MGKALHLDEKWLYNIVKQVGNYGEIFERNVGKDSPLKLERGLNALWTKGGLMYAHAGPVTARGSGDAARRRVCGLRAALLQAAGARRRRCALGAYLVHNTLVNMARQGIATGFAYLGREASFEIGETLDRLYARPTAMAARCWSGCSTRCWSRSLGIVLATVLGTRHRHRAALAQLARAQARARPMSRCCATCRCCCSSSCGGTCCG